MQLDHAIEGIETLYTQITGQEVPKSSKQPYAPILPERDPVKQVEARLEQLLGLLQQTPLPMLSQVHWTPQAAILESEHELQIKVDLPGLSKDEIQTKVESGRLVIKGLRVEKDAAMQQVVVHLMEKPSGRFERSFEIPPALIETKFQQQLTDGVLTVSFPKRKTK